MMKRVEFHIAYKCFNKCIFCSEHDQLNRFSGEFVPKKYIIETISKLAKKGFNHLTLTGGEPSLHPDFMKILYSAKELGYRNYITTNGGMFCDKAFSRDVSAFIDEICFSLHGHNSKLHNFLTFNKGSFRNIIAAMNSIDKVEADIFGFINIVVNKYNFEYITEIINLAGSFKKIKSVLISNFAPEAAALCNFQQLSVPLDMFKARIGSIVTAAKKNSLVLRFFGLPLCTLGGHRDLSNDLHWSPRLTIEKKNIDCKVVFKKTISYKPVRGRIKSFRCQDCLEKSICAGVFEKYYKEFGDRELNAFG